MEKMDENNETPEVVENAWSLKVFFIIDHCLASLALNIVHFVLVNLMVYFV